jgi:GTP-binding protein
MLINSCRNYRNKNGSESHHCSKNNGLHGIWKVITLIILSMFLNHSWTGLVLVRGTVRAIGHGLKKNPIRNSNKKSIKPTPEQIEQMTSVDMELKHYMHGRKNRERLDSVTPTILKERARHQARLVAFADGNMTMANNNDTDTSQSESDDIDGDEGDCSPDGLPNSAGRESVESLEAPSAAFRTAVQTKSDLRQEVAALGELGFGRGKQRLGGVYKDLAYWTDQRKTSTAAGGFAQFLGSAVQAPWPLFRHLLPELAFTGHSNSGKSTLVNAMIGVRPNSQGGLAKAHERAGWTDEVYFYALGKRPPVLTLADLPGYGHAVASVSDVRRWKILSRSYLSQRTVLSLCFVLVDCTRGLCRDDHQMLRFLTKYRVPWQVILTKGDLLPLDQLAACRLLTAHELRATYFAEQPERAPEVGAISCNTGAGVESLWRRMTDVAYTHSRGPPGHDETSTAVREHRLANRMRSQQRA